MTRNTVCYSWQEHGGRRRRQPLVDWTRGLNVGSPFFLLGPQLLGFEAKCTPRVGHFSRGHFRLPDPRLPSVPRAKKKHVARKKAKMDHSEKPERMMLARSRRLTPLRTTPSLHARTSKRVSSSFLLPLKNRRHSEERIGKARLGYPFLKSEAKQRPKAIPK